MATTNQERVGKAMDLRKAGLAPYVSASSRTSIRPMPSRPPGAM